MNYNLRTKAELIELLKQRDEIIAKLENKTELRKELLEEAREKKEQAQEKRIKTLKRKIKEIIAEKKDKLSIRELCQVLEINRKTLYNNNLNEFFEMVIKQNFLKSGEPNFVEITQQKKRNKYHVSISESSGLMFAQDDHYEFSEKVELLEFLRDYKAKNEYRVIIEKTV
jgi:phosphopentomutase